MNTPRRTVIYPLSQDTRKRSIPTALCRKARSHAATANTTANAVTRGTAICRALISRVISSAAPSSSDIIRPKLSLPNTPPVRFSSSPKVITPLSARVSTNAPAIDWSGAAFMHTPSYPGRNGRRSPAPM